MILDILTLCGGLIMIIGGASFMTDGAALVARKFNVSEFIIGLTIIALGTSAPEIVVSISSALKGDTSMAVGNVVGSNMFNTYVIIGVISIIQPIRLSRETSKKTIPSTILSSLLLVIFAAHIFGVKFMPDKIVWIEGVIMVGSFIFFILKSTGISITKTIDSKKNRPKVEIKPLLKGIFMALAGLSVLLYGGDIFIDSAVEIATVFGVSKYVISVTLLGGGTSMPELVSGIIATRRGMPQMALGNVLGSNIANILLVLGGTSIITPLSLASSSPLDIALVAVGSLLLLVSVYTFRKHQIDRIEGVILLIVYVAYISCLILGK